MSAKCAKEGHNRRSPAGGCLECNRLKEQRRRAANPEKCRRDKVISELRLRYGLSELQYQQLFASQRGNCAICECQLVSCLDDTRPFGKGPLPNLGNVDHDHTTGKVRGLLCSNCNHALGKFKDDENLLLKAMRYLRESATA